MIGLDSRPRTRTGVLTQVARGNLILLDLEGGQYYALDDVGRRVWELCDGRRSVGQMLTTLCEEYDAPGEQVQADVLELLADLASDRLIENEE